MATVNEPKGTLKRRSPKKGTASSRPKPSDQASPDQVEPFTEEEMGELMRLDAAHNPVLADYWRNESDDHITSDS